MNTKPKHMYSAPPKNDTKLWKNDTLTLDTREYTKNNLKVVFFPNDLEPFRARKRALRVQWFHYL